MLNVKHMKMPGLRSIVNKISLSNEIMQTESNYIYAKVSNRFIDDVFPFLTDINIRKPDYSDEKIDHIGAHISIIYPDEIPNLKDMKITKQINDIQIEGLFSIEIANKRYYALKVVSQMISEIRNNCGLSPKLKFKNQYVDPHITVGVVKLSK